MELIVVPLEEPMSVLGGLTLRKGQTLDVTQLGTRAP